MKDGIIAETGNSRLIRANLPATYEELREMAAAGTLPMDILFNAAGWSQLPDFLGKATLLKDATAEALGLTAQAVPDEALQAAGLRLSALDSAVFDHAATYIWNKYSVAVEHGADMGETRLTAFNTANSEFEYHYSDAVAVSADGTTLSLVDPKSVTITPNTAATVGPVMAGKYIAIQAQGVLDVERYTVYYVPPTASFFKSDDIVVTVSNLYKPSIAMTLIGTAGGSSADTYPAAGMYGGYYYEYSSIDKPVPQIACGSFTTVSGSNVITLPFQPKFVLCTANIITYNSRSFWGTISGTVGSWSSDGTTIGITATGFTLSGLSAGLTLRYIAIG